MAIHSLQLDSICGKFCEGPAGRIVVPWNKTSLVSFEVTILKRLWDWPLAKFWGSTCQHISLQITEFSSGGARKKQMHDQGSHQWKLPFCDKGGNVWHLPRIIWKLKRPLLVPARFTRQLFSDRLWREDRKPAFSLCHGLGKIGIILILIRNMVHQNNYQLLQNHISVLQPKLWDAAKTPWGPNCANRCCVQQKQTSNGRCLWFGDKCYKALGAIVWVQSWQIFLLQQI